jgi:di/tricarboxylate transporter
MGELVGLTISGILRDGRTLLGPRPEERILPGDRLLVTGEAGRIRGLLALGGVELQQEVAASAIESEGEGLVEAAVAPRSEAAGRTLAEIDFRERYGLTVLAVWRQGRLLHEHLAHLKLGFGDALLLHGPWPRIRQLARGGDFLALTSTASEERRTRKAVWAVGAVAVMLGLAVTGWQPAHVATFVAAITMEEAYRAVEWRVIFLVAAILPIGAAMDATGGSAMLADGARTALGGAGPHVAVLSLALFASLLCQLFDGAPAVVMMAPVAFAVAEGIGVSVRPLMMSVALGASVAYLTPFSHKAHLLVMGAGGYRSMDYFRAGLPLTILHLGLIVGLVPLLFPF